MSIATLLCFDFGQRRIGHAVANTLTNRPQGLPTLVIAQPQPHEWLVQIKPVIQAWSPTLILVGLPVKPDGSFQDITRECWAFATWLHTTFHKPCIMIDERYSSTASYSALVDERQIESLAINQAGGKQGRASRGKQRIQKTEIDQRAAMVLLGQYFTAPQQAIPLDDARFAGLVYPFAVE
jgi:putative Holliday junction resolvase